jgi:gluconokinase
MLVDNVEPEIIVTGGLLKSPVWMKITADFFGKKLWKPKVEEASAWGAIIVALMALGVIDNLEEIQDWVEVEESLEPDPLIHETYAKIFQTYTELHDRLMNFHPIHQMTSVNSS